MTRLHTDLSRVPVSVAPSPATSGTSLGVTDANAAYLPDTYPYWAVVVPTGAAPTRANAEIVKVTAGSSSGGTTTLTIVRAQGTPVTTAQTVTTSFDIYDANSSEANIGLNHLVINETPSGTVNGSNAAFDTANAYVAGTIQVYRDGQLMKGGGADYTETDSNTITFTTAPATGSVLLVSYQKTFTTSGNADTLDGYHANATPTASNIPVADASNVLRNAIYAPQGFLQNGKIVPSVASNNLTVALKGLDGNDPSATNPVYIRIGDTVRSITSALSVTKNAGTNWMNAGSSALATKEIDYFVYLHWNTVANAVSLGFARIAHGRTNGDFASYNSTEEKSVMHNTGTGNSTDAWEVVGRFAATLSAGTGYTWSVPTYTNVNLIQRPIYETRWLNYVPTFTGSGGSIGTHAVDRTLGKYKIRDSAISLSTHSRITNVGSWSGDLRMDIPFKPNYESTTMILMGTLVANNANPLASSKGLAFLLDGGSLIYFTTQIWNTYVQWSSVAAVDSVLINNTYSI